MSALSEKVMYDERFQAACQRYAHGGGSSSAIAKAAMDASAAPELLEAAVMQDHAEEANANCAECCGEGNWADCSQCSVLYGDAIAARHAAIAKARGEA